jgi:hypothetical protein
MEAINSLNLSEPGQSYNFGFDPSERVKSIDLDLLSRSIRIEAKDGSPLSVRPKQSWELLKIMIGLLDQYNVNYKVDDIFVQQQGSYPRLNDEDKQRGFSKVLMPVTKFEFEKVLSRIYLPNLADAQGNEGGIAMNFHKEGIEIAFGMQVKVCQNWSILGRNVIRTYTWNRNHPFDWESTKIKLAEWVRNLKQLFKVEQDVMHGMMEHEISEPYIIDNILGELYYQAIKQAYFKGDPTPFDTAQLSLFVQEMIRQKKEEEKLSTVWDLYNWGTAIMKPGITNDMAGIQNSISMYSDFLCDRFDISVPEAVIVE